MCWTAAQDAEGATSCHDALVVGRAAGCAAHHLMPSLCPAGRPQVVVAFVRSSHDALAGGHGGWGAAAAGRPWQETPWRRSALAFVQVRAHEVVVQVLDYRSLCRCGSRMSGCPSCLPTTALGPCARPGALLPKCFAASVGSRHLLFGCWRSATPPHHSPPLQDLGLLGGAHASVANRIAAEAAALDRAIRTSERCCWQCLGCIAWRRLETVHVDL